MLGYGLEIWELLMNVKWLLYLHGLELNYRTRTTRCSSDGSSVRAELDQQLRRIPIWVQISAVTWTALRLRDTLRAYSSSLTIRWPDFRETIPMKTFKEALSLFQLQTGKTFARSRDCKSIRANLYVLRTCFPTIDPHNEPTLGNHYSDSSLTSLYFFCFFSLLFHQCLQYSASREYRRQWDILDFLWDGM